MTADINELGVPVFQLESPEIDEPISMQLTTYSDELEEIMKLLANFFPLITNPKEHNRLVK